MTAKRPIWPDGIGVVVEDLQRMADAASAADDLALQQVLMPGDADGSSVVKRIRPLLPERHPAGSGDSSGLKRSLRVLAVEAAFYGGDIGRVAVLPCAVDVFALSNVQAGQQLALSGLNLAGLLTGTFASSVSGRVDTVYLSVTMDTPPEAAVSRRMKDTTSGAVSTDTVDVYSEPTVTIAVAPGTNGSSTPGAVPADGSGVYNVEVAQVWLPAGYVSGGILVDGGGSFVRQTWTRGGIQQAAVQSVRRGTMTFTAGCDAGPTNNLHTRASTSTRGTGMQRVRAVFRHTGTSAVCVLDTGINWCLRDVRVSVKRSTQHAPASPFGLYVPPSNAVTGGGHTQDSGWVDSGLVNDVSLGDDPFWTTEGNTRALYNPATPYSAGAFVLYAAKVWENTSGGVSTGQTPGGMGVTDWTDRGYALPPTMKFFARNSDGALVVTITDAPMHADGDHYTVIAECLDQSDEGGG